MALPFFAKIKLMEIDKKIIKVILFDLWGTLAHVTKGEISLKIKNQLGFNRSLIHAVDDEIIRRSKISLEELKIILKSTKIRLTGYEIKKLYDILTDVSGQEYEPYPDTKIIPLLKEKYRLGIVSNIIPPSAKRIKRKLSPFLKNFNHLIFSCDLGIAKPDKKIYIFAYQKFNVKPNEVLMVGNSFKDDILPAKKLGMQAVLLTRNGEKKEEIKSLLELRSLL